MDYPDPAIRIAVYSQILLEMLIYEVCYHYKLIMISQRCSFSYEVLP